MYKNSMKDRHSFILEINTIMKSLQKGKNSRESEINEKYNLLHICRILIQLRRIKYYTKTFTERQIEINI